VTAYQRRLVDDELDDLLPDLAAIAIEGPKGVGKSATAERRAKTVLHLDILSDRQSLETYPARLDDDRSPILLDEWQRMPSSWDLVRRSVDRNNAGGRFLLTGSATPPVAPMHSGAGRIVRLRMRPMSIVERRPDVAPSVHLSELLTGSRPKLDGRSAFFVGDYTDEILRSGFPGIRDLSPRGRTMQLDGYIERIVDVDFAEQGQRIRRPATLRAWLRSYAAATSTTTTYTSILDAATPGVADKPAKSTTVAYRDVLERLWILDPVPGWLPSWNHAARLASAPKHQLADPALSARLLGANRRGLLTGDGSVGVRDGLLLGGLFESLVVQSVRTYAQRAIATVHHMRTASGDHEVDVIVEGDDRRVVAIETKLGATVEDNDVKHLKWLMKVGGDLIADAIVVTTGEFAYRRPDGIGVVPLALLGP
jgi:uncharacterized protein